MTPIHLDYILYVLFSHQRFGNDRYCPAQWLGWTECLMDPHSCWCLLCHACWPTGRLVMLQQPRGLFIILLSVVALMINGLWIEIMLLTFLTDDGGKKLQNQSEWCRHQPNRCFWKLQNLPRPASSRYSTAGHSRDCELLGKGCIGSQSI